MTDDIEIYSLDQPIENQTYGHWTGEWWKYMISSNSSGNGGIFKSQTNDNLWFLASEFVNEPTPHYESPEIKVGAFFLCPINNQFVYSSSDKFEPLQNRTNFFVNSTKKIMATIEKQGDHITPLNPIRVYTSITELKYTKNLSAKVDQEDLFYSIDNNTTVFKDGQNVYAFADGYWVFFKIVSPGGYKLQTYAEMPDFSNISEIFKPQADYKLRIVS